jgi:hypothetical protein
MSKEASFVVQPISFSQIELVWRNELWPDRKSPIRSLSSMLFMGDNDLNIYTSSEPKFYGIFKDDKLVGVNSGFATSTTHWRSRGLWVAPHCRNKGFSKLLLAQVINDAIMEKKELIWSFPRQSSFFVYQAAGFSQCSEWTNDGEFGPNCYASLKLQR